MFLRCQSSFITVYVFFFFAYTTLQVGFLRLKERCSRPIHRCACCYIARRVAYIVYRLYNGARNIDFFFSSLCILLLLHSLYIVVCSHSRNVCFLPSETAGCVALCNCIYVSHFGIYIYIHFLGYYNMLLGFLPSFLFAQFWLLYIYQAASKVFIFICRLWDGGFQLDIYIGYICVYRCV